MSFAEIQLHKKSQFSARILLSLSVILVYNLFTILKNRRELHISQLHKPLKKTTILVVRNSRLHENYLSLANPWARKGPQTQNYQFYHKMSF